MSNRFFALLLVSVLTLSVKAQQDDDILGRSNENDLRTITTAVPFLLITPDTRAGGMGDVGVSTSADANSIHWNIAKLAFAEKDSEISFSYSPWLKKIVSDMNLAYLSGYKKIGKNQAISGSLRYFTLGDIKFTNENAQVILDFEPKEFAVDAGYALQLSDKISGGLAARYIFSNLTGGISANSSVEAKAGNSFAVDVAAYYENDDVRLGDYKSTLAFGLNISNIGAKMAYTTSGQRDFIPTNLRFGPSLTMNLDEYNKLTFAFEGNKLLVPSTPIYDSTGTGILAGRDPNVGVASGIFGSFGDAPGVVTLFENGDVEVESGSVLREELREINLATGLEYWYQDQFALRAGYFFEHSTKGGRKYATLGAGVKYNVFSFDFSYLIPTQQNNPLANTLRFTLRMNFDAVKSSGGDGEQKGI
ncbi:MAG: hypothetical protein ACI8XB_001188 [Patiriisocius sp.]|jgi:hypothetical protein